MNVTTKQSNENCLVMRDIFFKKLSRLLLQLFNNIQDLFNI